jgi:hypothetical protein
MLPCSVHLSSYRGATNCGGLIMGNPKKSGIMGGQSVLKIYFEYIIIRDNMA